MGSTAGSPHNPGTQEGEGRRTARAGTHLPAVVVGSSGRAVRVIRVQTGPPHVGLAHLCLVKQLPEALKGGKGTQFFQELLGIQVGPLDVGAAAEGETTLVRVRDRFPPSELLLGDPCCTPPSCMEGV